MYSPNINPVGDIIKTPPRTSKTKKRMRSPSRTPLQSPLQTGNPNPFTINAISFPLSPFNRDNDPNVIIGNRIDGLGMTNEEVERLTGSIVNDEKQTKKERRSELRKQNTSKESRERARIRSKEYRERQKKLNKNKQKKSGGKRTRKQIKKHKKSRQSKKA
jgi:hypothetical protein